MILGLFVSYGVGSIFTRSLYQGTLRTKNIPVLDKAIPKVNRHKHAYDIMTKDVITFQPVEYLSSISKMLTIYPHFNGFPIINTKGRTIGLINKNTLITLI